MIKKIIGKSLALINRRIVRNDTREDIAFADQYKISHSKENKVIFDVGAYDGETALRYNKLFNQNCTIYCFEPFEKSFELLKAKTNNYDNIKLNNFALGNKNGTIDYHVNKFSATNSLLPTSDLGKDTWGTDILETKEKISVSINTIDDFAQQNEIEKIDILKMDTQGSEYLVLEGAKNMIKSGNIQLVYTEINVMPSYKGQKEFDEMLKIMREYGYELFNLYLALNPKRQLRYLDAIFIYKTKNYVS